MKKLYTLKKWLTLQEAARHLAIVLGDDVCEADVLRLALDGHLILSVNFINHTSARQGKIIPIQDAQYQDIPSELLALLPISDRNNGKASTEIKGLNLDNKRVLKLDSEVVTLSGVYDLAMVGNERLDIEHEFQMLIEGPEVTLQGFDGTFVSEDADTMYQLVVSYDENEYQPGSKANLRELESRIAIDNISPVKATQLRERHKEARKIFLEAKKELANSGRDSGNYYPAGGLPQDCILVVRTEALRAFEHSINDQPAASEKPLTPTERNTLLVIIAALCSDSMIDPKTRGAAQLISGMTDGINASVTDDTIRKVLKQIPDAMERRRGDSPPERVS